MKLVLINGPSCAGKSTAVDSVMKNKENYFRLSYDSIKWSFSNYVAFKYSDEIYNLMLIIMNEMCRVKFDIICDSVIFKEHRQELTEVAEKYGYKIVSINLEANYDIVLTRYEQRKKEIAENLHKEPTHTSLEKFKELFDRYHNEKDPDAVTFDTGKQTQEEVSTEVLALL